MTVQEKTEYRLWLTAFSPDDIFHGDTPITSTELWISKLHKYTQMGDGRCTIEIIIEDAIEGIEIIKKITGTAMTGIQEFEDGEWWEWYDENGDCAETVADREMDDLLID